MFSTFIKLNTLENMARAVSAVNKVHGARLRQPGLLVLLTLFGCENRGEVITQRRLLDRLGRFHNMTSCKLTVAVMTRLVDRGLIERRREGRAFILSCTLSGRQYCIDLERALRNVRFNK
jgi:hypothetical protein